jgi:hypothetical protein
MPLPSAVLNPGDWEPLAPAWQRFAAEQAPLGLGESRFAAARFARAHYPTLARLGVMIRSRGGRYFVHRRDFPAAAFTVLMQHETTEVAA